MISNPVVHRSRALVAAIGIALVLVALGGTGRPSVEAAVPAQAAGGVTYRLTDTWTDRPWSLVAGRFGRVLDVSSAPDGTIYVLDGDHAAIHVLNRDGAPLRAFVVPPPPADFAAPRGRKLSRLDVGFDGRLYVLSLLARDEGDPASWVDVLEPSGTRSSGFGREVPYTDIGVRADGAVYLTRNRPLVVPTPEPRQTPPRLPGGVDVFDARGTVIATIEHPSIFYALGVDIAADGTIYIVNRAPSPWDYETPGPRPTPLPALARPMQSGTVIEGIAVFDPAHRYVETVPFVTPEDVAVGGAGVYISRNVEIFALRETTPLYSGPPGQVAVGFVDGFVLHLDVSAQGRLLAGMGHCYFQGVLRFDAPAARPATPRMIGVLDRPDLRGPTNPWRIDAGEDVVLLQGRFAVTVSDGSPAYQSVPFASQPQSVQRWTPAGRLASELGVCSGSTSGWLPDPSDALWTRDVAVDGRDVYTIDPQLVHRRPDDRFPAWTFWSGTMVPADGATHLVAVSADAGKVAVLDTGSRQVAVLDRDGNVLGSWAPSGDGPNAVYGDLALSGNRVFVADTGNGQVLVRDLAGADLGTWATHDGPWRIDASPSGDLYALGRHGWAMRYDPGGALVAAWPMPDRQAQAMDIAVGDDGRVYVPFIDREPLEGAEGHNAWNLRRAGVWVFEAAAKPPAEPPAVGSCLVNVDKTAAPQSVRRGDGVEVRLSIAGACPGQFEPVQVALLVDTSRSMNWDDAIERARGMALALVGRLDPRAAEVAVVTFDDEGALLEGLTRDLGAVAERIAGLEAWGDTKLAAGIAVAHAELDARRDPLARRLIVIITDGEFTDVVRPTADAARSDGIELHALALPHGGMPSYLAALRSITGQEVIVDPDASAIDAFADRLIRYRAASGLFERLTVTDVVPGNMAYVTGTASPAATWDGQALAWSLGAVRAGQTVTLSYRLEPAEVGTWPTNVRADAAYRDASGADGTVAFPVPRVRVWDASSLTTHIYLPLTAARSCFRTGQALDVALVIDASESMGEAAQGGGTKLDAARAAAEAFLDLLQLPGDHAAVVAFNSGVVTRSPLTGDHATLTASLGAIVTSPGTRIDLGLAAAGDVLGAGRADAQTVVVLLTDGLQSGETAPVLARAAQLRAAGVLVFTVGLGTGTDAPLLAAVATTPDDHLESPSDADLARVYRRVLRLLLCRLG
jgi:Mg-chelatase subunit ChlD